MNKKKAFSLIELSIVILILGILIAGITQSSRLVREYKLNGARTVTQNSPVTSMKDLLFWVETSMPDSLTSTTNGKKPDNNDKISTWTEYNPQAHSKITLTQATDAARPTYLENGISSLPTLLFNGAQNLDTSIGVVPAGSSEYTYFIVFQHTAVSATQVIFHQRGTPSDCNGTRLGLYTNVGGNLNVWGCGSGDYPIGATTISKPYAAVYRYDKNSNPNSTFYLNGSKTGPYNTSLNNLSSDVLGVGWGNSGGSTFYYRGYISEIIIFSRALEEDEMIDIRAYLAKKYSISA